MAVVILSFVLFLLGSVPFGGIIAAVAAGVDITGKGSGNIGATNVARELGFKWGLLTLALDVSKGFIPVFILERLYCFSPSYTAILALMPVLGHQFSIFMRFKGGKGVATAAGVWFAVTPLSLLLAVIPFIAATALCRMVSVGSLSLVFTLPLFIWLKGEPFPFLAASLITSFLVFYRHRENIKRIAQGTEPRLKLGRQLKS